MFELTISTSLDKQLCISNLYKKLLPEIKNMSGVAIKENSNGRSSVSLAVKKEYGEFFKAKILDAIVEIVVNEYKFNFFKDNLIVSSQKIIYNSFIKAISIFDADADREYIKKQIDFSGKILIDSLYNFKLQELKQRWQKTVDIIELNGIIKNESTILDILKYLTSMSESVVESADVFISKDKLKIKHYSAAKNYKNDFSGLSDFLTEMIELNPAKINIRNKSEDDKELVHMLEKIFYDKINF